MEIFDKNNNPIDEMYDDEGNLIENVLTPEEAEQKVKDAQEEVKADYDIEKEDLQTKYDEKEEELKQAQEDLQKAGNKGENFKNLRDSKNKKEEELTELKEKFDKLDEKVTQQGSATKEQIINDSIAKLSDGDKELADKIKFHYDGFVIPSDDTPEKQKERLDNAILLASGGNSGSVLNSDITGSGSGNNPVPTEGGGKLSDPEAANVAKQLGLDDKDLKKNKLI